MSYAIVTDTSANLPLKMLKERDILLLAFSYRAEGGPELQQLDTEDFDGELFYEQIRRGARVTTSQITPYDYETLFTRLLDEGKDILLVSMSSGISGSFSSACMAAGELRERYPDRRIELVDTFSASLGEGLVVLEAAALREAGVDIQTAAERLRALSRRMCQVFTVDDLMYLRRGGRLSNLSAIVGTILNIKPILIGDEEGRIVAIKKIRGRKHSIQHLAELYARYADPASVRLVGIAHADCPGDAELLRALLAETPDPPENVLNVQYEPVTGSHVGPGALALFFFSDDQVRSSIQK